MPKANKKNDKSKKQQQQVMTPEMTRQVTSLIKRTVRPVQVQDGVSRKSGGVFDLVKTFSPVVSGLAKIIGMGDYTVESNTVALSGSAVNEVPAFPAMRGNRIRHKECLGTVAAPGNTAFNILRKIRFNPSDPLSFPWLSSFATNFTGYKVHGAAVVFETNTSEYSAVPYMGTICIGTRYDTREPDFTSILEMQNCKFSVSSKPSQCILHPIECKDGFQPFDSWLTRRGTEINTTYGYDKCNVYVAVDGLQANTAVLGRIWITYDIELINPVTPPSAFTYLPRSYMVDTGGNGTFPTVTSATVAPFQNLYANFSLNTTYNTIAAAGEFGILIKDSDAGASAPYAALFADGTLRVYKTCSIYVCYIANGTVTPTTVGVNTVAPLDGSTVTVRRENGGNNNTSSIKESFFLYVNLKNPSENSPLTNTYYATVSLTNVGTAFTGGSCRVAVNY